MTDAERKQRYDVVTKMWIWMNERMKKLPNTDVEYEDLKLSVEAMYEPYKQTQVKDFAKDMILAMTAEIDRLATKERGDK